MSADVIMWPVLRDDVINKKYKTKKFALKAEKGGHLANKKSMIIFLGLHLWQWRVLILPSTLTQLVNTSKKEEGNENVLYFQCSSRLSPASPGDSWRPL